MSEILPYLLYFVPPLAVGYFVFGRLKKKYGQPVGAMYDWRVYILTTLAVSGAFMVNYALWFLFLTLFAA